MKRPVYQGRPVAEIRVYPKPYPTRERLDPRSLADQQLLVQERASWSAWPFDLEVETDDGAVACLYGEEARRALVELAGLSHL